MPEKKQGQPRRKGNQLAKSEAKDLALTVMAEHLEGNALSMMESRFVAKFQRLKKRVPSPGERDLFIGEIAKVTEGLLARVKQRV